LCGKWFDKSEEDGQIERDVPATGQDGKASTPLVSYKISVVTGDRHGAGTDANVFIQVFGDKGASGKRKLESGDNNFERNKTDVFGFEIVDMGELSKYVQIFRIFC
jgi:hypothetical protein